MFSGAISSLARADSKSPATQPSAKSITQDIPGSTVSIDMVAIPGGQYKTLAGKTVAIKPLYVSKTEIPWDAYNIFAFRLDMTEKEKAKDVDAKSRPSHPYGDQTHGFGNHGYPAIHITRNAAEHFCLWLSKKTGQKYRLPTEAEWEYACTCGGTEKAPEGDALDKVAWYWDNSDDKTHPVGKKSPNKWGLYDMLGNVAEYVTIPGEPADAMPTACGGSYDDKPEDITCAARKTQDETWNSTDPQNPKSVWWLSDGPFVGFRIVREQ
jgi:formylglycine-generating enzyme required for sulfatase activity